MENTFHVTQSETTTVCIRRVVCPQTDENSFQSAMKVTIAEDQSAANIIHNRRKRNTGKTEGVPSKFVKNPLDIVNSEANLTSKVKQNAKRKLMPCDKYRKGQCQIGVLCGYMHQEFPCIYFYLNIKCPDEQHCKFLHNGPLPLNILDALIKYAKTFPINELCVPNSRKLKKADLLHKINETQTKLLQKKYAEDKYKTHLSAKDNRPLDGTLSFLSQQQWSKLTEMGVKTHFEVIMLTNWQLNALGITTGALYQKIIDSCLDVVQQELLQVRQLAENDKIHFIQKSPAGISNPFEISLDDHVAIARLPKHIFRRKILERNYYLMNHPLPKKVRIEKIKKFCAQLRAIRTELLNMLPVPYTSPIMNKTAMVIVHDSAFSKKTDELKTDLQTCEEVLNRHNKTEAKSKIPSTRPNKEKPKTFCIKMPFGKYKKRNKITKNFLKDFNEYSSVEHENVFENRDPDQGMKFEKSEEYQKTIILKSEEISDFDLKKDDSRENVGVVLRQCRIMMKRLHDIRVVDVAKNQTSKNCKKMLAFQSSSETLKKEKNFEDGCSTLKLNKRIKMEIEKYKIQHKKSEAIVSQPKNIGSSDEKLLEVIKEQNRDEDIHNVLAVDETAKLNNSIQSSEQNHDKNSFFSSVSDEITTELNESKNEQEKACLTVKNKMKPKLNNNKAAIKPKKANKLGKQENQNESAGFFTDDNNIEIEVNEVCLSVESRKDVELNKLQPEEKNTNLLSTSDEERPDNVIIKKNLLPLPIRKCFIKVERQPLNVIKAKIIEQADNTSSKKDLMLIGKNSIIKENEPADLIYHENLEGKSFSELSLDNTNLKVVKSETVKKSNDGNNKIDSFSALFSNEYREHKKCAADLKTKNKMCKIRKNKSKNYTLNIKNTVKSTLLKSESSAKTALPTASKTEKPNNCFNKVQTKKKSIVKNKYYKQAPEPCTKDQYSSHRKVQPTEEESVTNKSFKCSAETAKEVQKSSLPKVQPIEKDTITNKSFNHAAATSEEEQHSSLRKVLPTKQETETSKSFKRSAETSNEEQHSSDWYNVLPATRTNIAFKTAMGVPHKLNGVNDSHSKKVPHKCSNNMTSYLFGKSYKIPILPTARNTPEMIDSVKIQSNDINHASDSLFRNPFLRFKNSSLGSELREECNSPDIWQVSKDDLLLQNTPRNQAKNTMDGNKCITSKSNIFKPLHKKSSWENVIHSTPVQSCQPYTQSMRKQLLNSVNKSNKHYNSKKLHEQTETTNEDNVLQFSNGDISTIQSIDDNGINELSKSKSRGSTLRYSSGYWSRSNTPFHQEELQDWDQEYMNMLFSPTPAKRPHIGIINDEIIQPPQQFVYHVANVPNVQKVDSYFDKYSGRFSSPQSYKDRCTNYLPWVLRKIDLPDYEVNKPDQLEELISVIGYADRRLLKYKYSATPSTGTSFHFYQNEKNKIILLNALRSSKWYNDLQDNFKQQVIKQLLFNLVCCLIAYHEDCQKRKCESKFVLSAINNANVIKSLLAKFHLHVNERGEIVPDHMILTNRNNDGF